MSVITTLAFVGSLAISPVSYSTIDPELLLVRTRDGGTLCAEIETASPRSPRPAIIFISGAGPHTREYSTDAGNSEVGNRAFAVLRDAVVNAGFTAVRYDERGTGCSTGDYAATATTMTLADDVEDLIVGLRERSEVAAGRIILLGHSEGPSIAWIVATRTSEVSGVIALAAPAWTGRRIIEWQHREFLREAEQRGNAAAVRALQLELEREHTTRSASDPWYQFFLDFDPLPVVSKVRVPILLLHGEMDELVSVDQALELATRAREAGNERVSVVVLPGHDHGLGAPGHFDYVGKLGDRAEEEILRWSREEQRANDASYLKGLPAGAYPERDTSRQARKRLEALAPALNRRWWRERAATHDHRGGRGPLQMHHRVGTAGFEPATP